MRAALALSTAVVAVAAAVLIPAATASAGPAPICYQNCEVTVAPGAQSSWDVPSNLQDLTVELAGGSGGDANIPGGGTNSGGTAGDLSLDLGTAYNGKTLYSLVGARGSDYDGVTGGAASGGGGSYIATSTGFVAIAGGGGGAGTTDALASTLAGGSGGYGSNSPDGFPGLDSSGEDASGGGATGATPGAPSAGADVTAHGHAGTAASVAASVITPGDGGAPANGAAGAGGGGYAGGAGGSVTPAENGAGGGGSGFAAAGSRFENGTPHRGAGFITITYSIQPTISAPVGDVRPGGKVTSTIALLDAGSDFGVAIDETGRIVIPTATIDAAADPKTVSFVIPKSTPAGSYRLLLQYGDGGEALSDPFAVSIPGGATGLALTGVDDAGWMTPTAAGLIALGLLLVWFSQRRRAAYSRRA